LIHKHDSAFEDILVRFQGDYIMVGLPAMRLQGFLTFAEIAFRIYALSSQRVLVRPGHMNHFVFLLKRETKRGAIGVAFSLGHSQAG
jgi:hypothetical protein